MRKILNHRDTENTEEKPESPCPPCLCGELTEGKNRWRSS